MKIKEGFVLKQVGDKHIVVPLHSRVVDFSSIIKLSDSGAFLWTQLESEQTTDTLLSAMLKEYDIDETTALKDIEKFISKLKEHDLVE